MLIFWKERHCTFSEKVEHPRTDVHKEKYYIDSQVVNIALHFCLLVVAVLLSLSHNISYRFHATWSSIKASELFFLSIYLPL